MNNIRVTLPDGSAQTVEAGTRPLDIARQISPRLADAAIVARVNGKLFDLTRRMDEDATLEILTAKNPETLEVYRHSTAHLLAAAVLELFPERGWALDRPPTTASSTISSAPNHSLRKNWKRWNGACGNYRPKIFLTSAS